MNNRVGDNLIHFGPNKELVLAFRAEAVNFVVVGGLAVAWYCSERQADDMDLLVEPSIENSARIARALTSLRLAGFSSESFAKPGLQVPLKGTFHAELLTPQDGTPSFSDIEALAVDAQLFDIPVRLASRATLIAMKERAASAEGQDLKHARDIELLREPSSLAQRR